MVGAVETSRGATAAVAVPAGAGADGYGGGGPRPFGAADSWSHAGSPGRVI
jgi:hypothetical protein